MAIAFSIVASTSFDAGADVDVASDASSSTAAVSASAASLTPSLSSSSLSLLPSPSFAATPSNLKIDIDLAANTNVANATAATNASAAAVAVTPEQPSPLSRPVRLQNLGRLVGPPPISDSPTPYSSCSTGGAPQDRAHRQGSHKSPPQQPRLLAMPALPPSCRLAAAAAAAAGKKRRRSSGPSSASSSSYSSSECARGRTLYLPLKKRRRRSANNGNGRGGRSRSPSRSPSPKRSSSSSPPLSSLKKPSSSSPVPAGGAKAPTALPPRVVGGGGLDEVPLAEVRTVSPTVRGIAESARILLSLGRGPSSPPGPQSTPSKFEGAGHDDAGGGVLSFPTETVYSLACCVSVRNFVRRSARIGGGPRSNSASSTGSTGSSGAEEALVKAEGRGGSQGTVAAGCGDGGPAMSRLLRIKGRHSPAPEPSVVGAAPSYPHSSILDRDVPLVYLHDPSHSRRFARFSKPKTFVLKPAPLAPTAESSQAQTSHRNSPTKDENKASSSSDPKEATDKTPRQRMRPAVTFSESREVLDRLAAAFWPGPAVVYAPVKVRRAGGSTRGSVSANFKAARGGARASSTSGGEESVEEGGGGGGGRGNDAASASSRDAGQEFAPILPRGALVSVPTSLLAPSSPQEVHSQASAPAPQAKASPGDESRPPLPNRGCDKEPESSRLFVGMRCPSHPLARRVLAEVYASSSCASSSASIQGGGTPSKRGSYSSGSGGPSVAVVGFDASVPSFPATSHQGVRGSPPPTTARDVCASLLSSASSASTGDEAPSATTTVHVLNGEDKREIFSVPTCQYGADPPPPALLIDDETRTIHILVADNSTLSGARGQGAQGQKSNKQRVPEIRREDVRRALLKPASLPEASASTTKDTMAAREARAGEEDKRRVMAAALSRWNVVAVTLSRDGVAEEKAPKEGKEKGGESSPSSSSSRAAQ